MIIILIELNLFTFSKFMFTNSFVSFSRLFVDINPIEAMFGPLIL